MKDTDELQKRLIASYLSSPELVACSPLAGRLAAMLTGKWRTIAQHIDHLVTHGLPHDGDSVVQRIMAVPHEGPASDYAAPEEVMDLIGSPKTEATVRGYERHIEIWQAQKDAEATTLRALARIRADGKINDPGEAVSEMVESLRGIKTKAGGDTDLAKGVAAAVERALKRRRDIETGRINATWGLPCLDSLCPLEPGRFYILAAAPKCGKTSLAMTAATATAAAGNNVGFISMEMQAHELSLVIASRMLNLDARAIRQGKISDEQAEDMRLLAEQDPLFKRVIVRDSTIGPSRCSEACVWALQRSRMQGGLGLLIVDYLGLFQSSDPRKVEYQVLTENTKRLKELAGQLDVPILCLAQMNREGRREQMSDGRAAGQVEPTIGALRGSGSIEQDADAVAFLWSEQAPDEREALRKVEFKLAASRVCGTGRHPLMFFGPQQKFTDANTHTDSEAASTRASKLRSTPSETEDLFHE